MSGAGRLLVIMQEPRRQVITVADPLVFRHLEYLLQCGKSARTIYQRHRSLVLLARALAVPLIEATPDMLYDWRAAMRCGPETTLHYVGDARMFYKWAVEVAGLRGDNPADKVPVPRIGRRLPRPIGEKQTVGPATGTKAFVLSRVTGSCRLLVTATRPKWPARR